MSFGRKKGERRQARAALVGNRMVSTEDEEAGRLWRPTEDIPSARSSDLYDSITGDPTEITGDPTWHNLCSKISPVLDL